MPFDGLALCGVINEIKTKIIGSRVQKIYQPSGDEIVLYFSDHEKSSLILSSAASGARVHFTQTKYENPEYPPDFCMILRKYLLGGILKNIYQVSFDRIAIFEFESLDDAGNLKKTKLIVELMGKHSNIILTDAKTDKVLDSIKHISGLKSSVRKVMPNFDYSFPPNDKLNPLDFDMATASGLFSFLSQKEPQDVLTGIFCGVSKPLAMSFVKDLGCNSLQFMSADDAEVFLTRFGKYVAEKASLDDAYIYFKPNGDYKDFSLSLYSALSEFKYEKVNSLSEAVDEFYRQRSLTDAVKHKYVDVIKKLELLCERENKKLAVRTEELAKAQDHEIYNIYGNLLLSNLHTIKKGDASATLQNFYSESMEEVTVKLKKEYTPSQNAQMYFKKYNKAKSAVEHLKQLIAENEEKASFLAEQLYFISEAENAEEAEHVINELAKAGYVKKKHNKSAQKLQNADFFRYVSEDGYEILAGKNSFQNNKLTFKTADKDDIWLHAKDIPASHVILRTNKGSFSEKALDNAAQIAVYHSKLKNASKVPVDYTYVKNVKKISSSSYGNVTFTDNKTVYMTADLRLIKSLSEKE